MKTLIATAALLLGSAASAEAAVPAFGTKDGELACVGLMEIGFRGATAAKPQVPQAVVSLAIAYAFYIGRLSVAAPNATKQDIAAALAKLSLEDKNAYVSVCLKKASEGMEPHLGSS